MRINSILLLVLHFSFSNAQSIEIRSQFIGNGLNGLTGKGSIFSGGKEYNYKNSWCAAIDFRIKKTEKLIYLIGLEFLQLKNINHKSIPLMSGYAVYTNSDLFTLIGIPFRITRTTNESKWSFSFILTPSINIRSKYTTSITCGGDNNEFEKYFGKSTTTFSTQIEVLRKFHFKQLNIGLGPTLRYFPISVTSDYKLKPFLMGIQSQFTWQKKE